jgi:hypothetical protein
MDGTILVLGKIEGLAFAVVFVSLAGLQIWSLVDDSTLAERASKVGLLLLLASLAVFVIRISRKRGD